MSGVIYVRSDEDGDYHEVAFKDIVPVNLEPKKCTATWNPVKQEIEITRLIPVPPEPEPQQVASPSTSPEESVVCMEEPIACNPVESLATVLQDEEMRRETAQDMIAHPRQRRFMERVMPIEWCHARYPEVYRKDAA